MPVSSFSPMPSVDEEVVELEGARRVLSLMARVLLVGFCMVSQRYSSFQSAPFPPPPLVAFGLFVEFVMYL